ncbi:hypothetical protein [Xanthomonas campestris]|uniref:hypothetical protein n=1 Tax=Xanthomonas campestris TaxID=339 RepID=UPI0011C357A1|nr:hypothetical protein [Xanthomonas campestris]MCC5069604.1 hypothetical protein [Xanthomonas campestris]MCC5086424.1 hypothetical protein [Xanthomonas campestris]
MDFDFVYFKYFNYFKRFCRRGVPHFSWGRPQITSCSHGRTKKEKNGRIPASEQDGVCDIRDLACFAAKFPAVAALAPWSHETCFMEHKEEQG